MVDRESLQSVSGLAGSGFLQVRAIFCSCSSSPASRLRRYAPLLIIEYIPSIALRLCIPNYYVVMQSLRASRILSDVGELRALCAHSYASFILGLIEELGEPSICIGHEVLSAVKTIFKI
jgi:hypothetical protein